MNILSFQSDVVYGHVGHAAARFALQRLGHEVWAIPTVLLSSHAGYPKVTGEVPAPGQVSVLVEGLAANGWLAQCDGVLSGYLGRAEQAAAVADAAARVKAANPAALYCLDPVFGDEGRIYAKPGVAEAMAHMLLPLADIVTPNVFELSVLSGHAVTRPGEALEAARKLGRPCVAATSVPDGARIGTVLLEDGEAWLASTPFLESVPKGAGDLFAALFFAHKAIGHTGEGALELAMRALFHVLKSSRGQGEMRLIGEQAGLADPPPAPDLRVEKLA
jgi:pyridoxine kinase